MPSSWPMATPSGHAFFLNRNVNSAPQRVLHEWGRFLQQEGSADAVDNWFTDSPDTSFPPNHTVASGPGMRFPSVNSAKGSVLLRRQTMEALFCFRRWVLLIQQL